MDTNKQKEKNQLPLLTPKNPDGSQRIIKQIMVIDPNKLRVAGLDLKMAEALRKSKGQQTQTSHAPVGEAISRAQKVELAKALNKKKKQAPALKEPPKTLTDAIRKLPFLHTSPASAVDPQVKIPTAPITHSPLKTHTVMLNFLKGNQKSSTIEVNLGSPKSRATKEDVEHPKASLKPSQAVTIKPEIPPEICKTVKTIESKIISPEVQFELKKRPSPAAAKEQKTALRVIKVPVNQAKLKSNLESTRPTPQKQLPTVIESKILSPAEKIDLSTLRVTSPTQVVLAAGPLTLSLPAVHHRTPEAVEKPKQGVVTQDDAIVSTNKPVNKKTIKQKTDQKDPTDVKSEANKPKRNWVRRVSKTEAISSRLSPKPAAEESAVDFINFLFETKSKFESETKVVDQDATTFLRSLFGDQVGLSPIKTDEPLQVESDSRVSEYPRKESLRQMTVEKEVEVQDETPKRKSQRGVVVIEKSVTEKEKHTSAVPTQQTPTIERTDGPSQLESDSNVSECTQKGSSYQMAVEQKVKLQDETKKGKSQRQVVITDKSVTEPNQQSARKNEKHTTAAPKEQTVTHARIEKTPEKKSENVSTNPATSVSEIVKDSPEKTEKNATAALKGQTLTKASEKNSRSLSENVSTNAATSVLEIVKDSPNKTEKNAPAAPKEQTPAPARIEKTPEKNSRSLSENVSTNPATPVPEIVKDSPKKTEKNATAALKGQTLTKASEKNSRSLSENVSTNPATSVLEIVKDSPNKTEKNAPAAPKEQTPAPARIEKTPEKNSRSLSENVSTNPATSVLEIVKDSPNKREKNATAAPKEQTPALARIEKTPEKNSRSLSENVSTNSATSVPEIVKHSPTKIEKNVTATSKERSPAVVESGPKKVPEIASVSDSTKKVGEGEKVVNEATRKSLGKKEEDTSEVQNKESSDSPSTTAHKPADPKSIAKLTTNKFIDSNLQEEGNLQDSKGKVAQDTSIVQTKLEETSTSSPSTTNTRRKSKKSVPVIVAKLSRSRKPPVAVNPKKLTPTSSESTVSKDTSIPSSSKEETARTSVNELKKLDKVISNKSPQKGGDIEELSQTQKKPLSASEEEKATPENGAKEKSTPNRSGTSKTRNSVSESKLETPDDMAKTEKMIVSQSSESVSKNSTYTTKPPEEPPLLSKTTEPAAEDGTVELNAKASGDLTQHRSIETKIDTELVKELPQVSRLESVIAEDSAVQSNIMTSVILPQQEINTKSDNTRSHDTDTPTKAVDAVLSNDMPLPICQQQQATTDTSSNTKPVEEIRGPSIPEDHLSSVKTTEHVEKPSGQDSTKSAEQTNVDTSSDTKVVESSQATLLGGTEIKQSRHFVITEMSAVETDDQLQQEAIHPSDIKPVEELSKTKTKPSRRSTSEKANEIKEKLTVEAGATQPVSINSAQQTIADTSSGTKTVESSQASLLEDIGMTHSCRSVTPEKLNVQSDDQQDTSDTKPVEELSKSKVKPRETKSSRRSISAKANEIKEQLPVTDDATQSNGLALTNPTQERTNDGTDAQPSLLDGTETKRSRRSLSKKTNEIVENLIKADSKTQSKEIAPENSSQQQVTTNKSDATPIEETLPAKADTTKHSHSIKISDSPDEVGKTDETVNIVSSSNEEPSRKEPNKRETGTQSSAKCDELQISDNLESTTQSEESKPNVSTKKSLRSVSVGKSETIEPVGIEAKLISGETIDKSLEENSTNPSNQQNNDAASDDNRVEQPSQELNRSRRSRRSTPVVLKIPPSSGMNKKKEQPSALSVKAIAEETKTRALASDLVSENSEDIENVKSTDVQVKADGSTNVSEALKECSTPIESLTQHQNIEITSKSVELLVSERASEESESVVKSTKKTRTKPKPILTTERKGSSKKAAITDGRPIKEEPPKKTEKLPKEISQKAESKENGSKSLQSTDASSTSNIGKLSNKTETLPTETKSSSKIEVCKPTTAAIQKTDDDPEAVNPDETPKGSKTTKGRKKRAKPKLNLSTSEEASKASSFSKESKLLPIDSQVNPSTDEPTSKTPQTIKGKKNVEAFSAELTATEDISQISDYSDGFEDCDIKDLIDVSIAAEKTLENQSNKPVSLFDAIKEKPPKQGKAKNPFRKAKPSSKAEQKPAEIKATEADFLGFNEKEIEEGLKSTSLRLSQSTENLLVSPSTSYNKKKGSPRVKKSPLSAGKKQKQEQQAWKKNSAATLKSWLKTSDSSPEPVKEDNQEIQPSTPKPKTAAPSKKRGTKQKDLKSSVEVNTAQGTEEDVVKTVEVKQTSDETPSRKRRLKTSVKLSDEMTCKTPSSRSKKGNEKSPSSTTKSKPKGAKDKEAVIKNEPNESTPIKPKKGSRKRPAPEPFTPGTEPPTKITHLSDEDIPIPIFTLPSAKSRGRQSKPSYKPVIPVNPLERKHKNDIEFNPRLLLVRKKEEFKSDEPLVDPDLQTVPKNASDVQCALCLGYTSKKNWIRHLSTHYGVGWVMGNPPTVNIKSRCSVLNYMIEFFKSSGVKGLECRICKGLRRSALGLLTHIEQCVLTEKEIEESRVVCEFCKNNYSRMSIPSHMRTCSAKPDPTRETKEPAESIHENDVLSNTGRVKRKSVIKAENNFRGMNEIEFIPEEFIKFIPQPEISLTNWQRDIQTFGKGFCIWKQCSFTAETIEELQTHCVHGVCPFYTNAIYKCIKCKYRSENNEAALNHVKSKHNPNPIKDFEGSSDDAPIESESSSSDSGSSGVDESETSEGTDVDREDGARSPKRKKGKKHKTKKRSIKRPKKVSTKDFKKLLPERSPKIASKVAKWYCSFLKDNYTVDALFISATPKIVQTNDDGYGPYFPKSALSMKFRLRGFSGFVGQFGKANIQPDQWQQLERFKGKGLPNEHILFVGGPVKRVAWAPLEPHPASSTQYLAISTRKDIEKYTRFLHPKLSRSLIYIQKYDISDSMELRGEIQYALAIDAGPVHCIEFMPSGGYAPNINRLGLLVVGTVETEIKVYSLPLKVAKKDCDMFPIVRLEPSFVLALEVIDNPNENMDNYQTQCVDLVWSQASGHSYIIGGFLNGFVGIWDISDDEDNLNRFCQNGLTKFVPVSYFWTMESRIKYMAAHYDMNGLRWLLVCNETRKLLLFDLREINKPILFYVETMRNICTGIDWPVVWENPSCSLGDASPSYGCCINTTSLLNLVYNSRRLDKFCCGASGLHFNPWKNLYVGGAENGDLQITTIREANLDISLRNKYDQKVVTSMDVARFDSEDISNQAIQQKLQDGYRLFEHDYKEKYGLIFGAPAKVKGMKAQKLYDPKRIVSINLSRLMRINCLRFNPNRNANNILAVGYNNGFLRILQSDWAKMLDESTSN